MGQNETDGARQDRLGTKDTGRHISAYVTKARSAIYERKTSIKPLLTLELFQKAAAKSPQAAKSWLARLQQIPDNAVKTLFEQLPLGGATPVAKQFALTLLALNRQRLLEPRS